MTQKECKQNPSSYFNIKAGGKDYSEQHKRHCSNSSCFQLNRTQLAKPGSLDACAALSTQVVAGQCKKAEMPSCTKSIEKLHLANEL